MFYRIEHEAEHDNAIETEVENNENGIDTEQLNYYMDNHGSFFSTETREK